MPRKQSTNLLFPLGGVVRGVAYQSQPPFTTDDALNVRPRDPFERRLRGGSRPGLEKAFTTQLSGASNRVRLVTQVRELKPSINRVWQDEFDATSSLWSNGSWAPDSISIGAGVAQLTAANTFGAKVRTAITTLDTTKAYTISLRCLQPTNGIFDFFEIYARLDDTTPDGDDSAIILRLSGAGDLELWSVVSGTATKLDSGAYTGNFPFTIALTIGTSNAITATTTGASLSATITTAAGTRFGFGIDAASTGPTQVDWFKIEYKQTGGTNVRRNRIFAIAPAGAGGSQVYVEANDGTMAQPGSIANPPTSDQQIQAVERLGVLYFVGTGVDLTSYDAEMDTYAVVTDTSSGTVPVSCRSVAVYQDCLALGEQIVAIPTDASATDGSDDNPYMWYLSKAGDPTNYDFSLTTTAAAVAAGQTDAGRSFEPVTAVVSHTDDYLLLGGPTSLSVIKGHPRRGGFLGTLSQDIGIISRGAWARGPDGETIFLSQQGLYMIGPGGLSYPQPLSRNRLPKELRNIDVENNDVSMVFDLTNDGIQFDITPVDGSAGTFYWFDWPTKTFWPEEYAEDHQPFGIVHYNSDIPADARVLFGSRDGYIRGFTDAGSADDGTAFSSFVKYGPIRLGNGTHDGLLNELYAVLDEQSGGVDWEVVTGDTAEASTTNASRTGWGGVWVAGRNRTARPRARGSAFSLKITGKGTRWSMESLAVVRETLGKHKVL